jgi:hypothetical protein
MVLMDMVITNSTYEPYNEGLLVVNAKRETILKKLGYQIKLSKLRQILYKLEELGLIVIIHKHNSNDEYFLGFRCSDGQHRAYLLYAMLLRYEDLLKENIENQFKKNKKPSIKDINPYCLDQDLKDFMKDNFNEYTVLMRRQILGEKTLFNVLYKSADIYRKPLPKLAIKQF